MKKTINYETIGQYLGKSENTIKGWKQKFPALLELVRIGMLCKLNNLDEAKLEKMIEIHEMVKRNNDETNHVQ